MGIWIDELIGTIERTDFSWREYAGRWRFEGSSFWLDGAFDPVGVQNPEWGSFIADFKYAVKPDLPDFSEVILHQRPALDDLLEFLGYECARDPINTQAVNTETIDIMDEIMPMNDPCCGSEKVQSYRPSLLDTLTQKQVQLAGQLEETTKAIEALKRNPDLQQTLDLLRKVARF